MRAADHQQKTRRLLGAAVAAMLRQPGGRVIIVWVLSIVLLSLCFVCSLLLSLDCVRTLVKYIRCHRTGDFFEVMEDGGRGFNNITARITNKKSNEGLLDCVQNIQRTNYEYTYCSILDTGSKSTVS
jgi:hypothetical protein